ncbi:MAG TPA: gliding motility-associated C-terminal domain-containing protein [Bacteroidales bacterium]|nr:gliding motility-associated C-terminal domain-containing protein [Bacteroidales bacterium]
MKLPGVLPPMGWLLFFLLVAGRSHAQFSAGVDDTINPGVPVTLSASYGQLANGVNTLDNRVEGPFPIGFNFRFFGTQYDHFFIGENGWISFEYDINWGATRNIRLPSSAYNSPKSCILGAMEDYNPLQAGSPYIFYQTLGTAPHRKLVVMWCQCPMFGCTDLSATFQIVLLEGDSIELHLFKKPICTNWDNKCTIGIQDHTGMKCDTLPGMGRNSTSFSVDREGWRFVPTSVDTYSVNQIPYAMEPITPGDKISYRWYAGSDLISEKPEAVVAPSLTTVYRAVCTLCNGEEFSDEVTVFVVPFIPNAFTPNGDGLNDEFHILGLPPENITQYNLQVFNRWGQKVFETKDILEGWDGKLNGEYCPEGVYLWVVFYEDNTKTRTGNKGTITLVR